MSQQYGIQPPRPHANQDHRPAAKYLVVIESGGSALAKLFLEDRTLVSEFSASSEEVSMMTDGLVPALDADTAAWDASLNGHSAAERVQAEVYTLDV